MKIYIHGDGRKMVPARHWMMVTPGGFKASDISRASMPEDWYHIDGDTGQDRPTTFNIEFKFGEAEVDDRLGKFMIDVGMAKAKSQRMRLIEPTPEELEDILDTVD